MRALIIHLIFIFAFTTGYAAPDLLVTHDGTGAVVLRSDGTIETFVPGTPGRVRSISPDPELPTTSIALPRTGRLLYALRPNPDGKTSNVLAYDMPTGESKGTWSVRGSGRYLHVTSDNTACVVGLKPRAKNEAPENWTVTMLDLVTGSSVEPFNLGLVPSGVALRDQEGSTPRLYVAGLDRIMTFTTNPVNPSWFYQSPGNNSAIALPREGPAVFLLRDAAFVIIDPARRHTEAGKVQLTSDDATTVVLLPATGTGLAASSDGTIAAVHYGRSIAWVDTTKPEISETVEVGAAATVLAANLANPRDANRAALMTSPTANAIDPVSIAAPLAEPRPEPAAIAAAPAAAAPQTESQAPVVVPPSPEPVAQVPEPMPMAAETPADNPPADEERPEPAGVIEPTPTPGEEPVVLDLEPEDDIDDGPVPPGLSGRITGELNEGTEIFIYGPDNIIRLHSRTKPDKDGIWSIPQPRPGRYRIIVTAGSDQHVFTSPEFRTIVIAREDEGMARIDFEVRGRL